MLKRLKEIFSPREPLATPQFNPDASHLAAAVLLAYARQIDDDEDASEQALLRRLGQSAFGLAADEADELVVLARQKAEDSTDLHSWTRQINQYFDHDENASTLCVANGADGFCRWRARNAGRARTKGGATPHEAMGRCLVGTQS